MSLFTLQLQIASDLHLETPITRPSYPLFRLGIHTSNLCLLGDIGLVKDDGLFAFLRRTLKESRGLRILYILGNHEAYQTTLHEAVRKLRCFEVESEKNYGGRFIFLHRDRYDIDRSTTILGCTLWSAISSEQAHEAQIRLTDFNEQRGIRGWSLEAHLDEHKRDVDWLNAQVEKLHKEEPHRQIVILTHHSPTFDSRAIDPQHLGSSLSTGFATDLSAELCWTSSAVKLWAFGHTHFSCAFYDEKTEKLVFANQWGYSTVQGTHRCFKKGQAVIIEAHNERWKLVKIQEEKETTTEHSQVLTPQSNNSNKGTNISKENNEENNRDTQNSNSSPNTGNNTKRSLLQRAADRIQLVRRRRPNPSER